MEIEFVWQRDCPNVEAARQHLMQALVDTGLPVRWREWCVDDTHCPEHIRAFGSPTILVDGVDVAGHQAGDGPSCRLYSAADGALSGAPSTAVIAAALRSQAEREVKGEGRFSWRRLGATVPAFAVALLPKVACPACWPAYAGVLSSLGVSFLIDTRYLFALTAAFLTVALFFLGFRARHRRGFGPFVLGLIASAVLLIGKFYFESDPAMFTGVGLLMLASFWNSWPRKLAASPECSACSPATPVRSCCSTTPPARPVVWNAPDTPGEMT